VPSAARNSSIALASAALKTDFRRADFHTAAAGPMFMLRYLGAGRPMLERARLGIAFAGDGRRAAMSHVSETSGRPLIMH
jgi:hypothetical protein